MVLVARNKAVSLLGIRSSGRLKKMHLHDILGMPVHDSIFQVEALEIGNCCSLYFFWKVEKAAKLRDLGDVQLDQQDFLVGIEEGHIIR